MPPRKGKGKHTRLLHQKVKTAKGRKLSSTNWLQRQLNDPFVIKAKEEGYRSRAAYKLIEIAEKYPLFHKGDIVVDLGAAPGGWIQVAKEAIGDKGKLVAIDLHPIEPIADVIMLQADFMTDAGLQLIEHEVEMEKVNVIVSDMAPKTTGHPSTDHLRIMALNDAVFLFAQKYLKVGGHMLVKIFQGKEEKDFIHQLRQTFIDVKYIKPKASRKGSAEHYVLAMDKKSLQ